MHCLDCRTQEKATPSVGICQGCGAGVCDSHVRVAPRSVRHGSLLGPSSETEARTVLCLVCVGARTLTAASTR
ncbi:DUF2180 family protein [Streptomyces sp. NPDC051569]|uniref:DUF2180 family protein n=1 Tax=Streptomyces sp. NPDC051569 TaxID=3365661 RepID=UPI0037BA00DD